ncbi:MAG: TetR/AcrR family transcriptional regulator [Actinomycetota bacterium]|nr:TetR/AcrR family transcriptional regulator [Actinomycetota bacterium]
MTEVGREGSPARRVPPNARGERTRRRIAESTLALLEERGAPPTSREIAERSGVSLRLVFHHFEDLDALYQAVHELSVERYGQLAPDVPADLPLHTRIERTVDRRATLYEAVGNLGRNSTALALSHPGVATALQSGRSMLTRLLEDTFAPEIQAAGRQRKEVAAALGVAVSLRTWDRLRRVEGLSVASSRRVVSRMLSAALADVGPDASLVA